MPEPQQQDITHYRPSAELPEPPRNALDELMHLGIGRLIEFGIRFGFVLAIAEVIALVVIVIIVIVVTVVLTLLGIGIGNLLLGNLTSLGECEASQRQIDDLFAMSKRWPKVAH